ncbi:hypothetical protein NE865_16639 [Phthorimaea operculella]|nr:hypothetical protein NE865_16639 [Phthorimaea operculella]
MNAQQRRQIRAILRKILNVVMEQIEDDILFEINKPKRIWLRQWIGRRPMLGGSALLLKELAIEDIKEYRDSMRMTEESFNWLLEKVRPAIEKNDTLMRSAIPAKIKLQAVIYMLATGNNLRSLSHFFRISKPSLSIMIPVICDAIYKSKNTHVFHGTCALS